MFFNKLVWIISPLEYIWITVVNSLILFGRARSNSSDIPNARTYYTGESIATIVSCAMKFNRSYTVIRAETH